MRRTSVVALLMLSSCWVSEEEFGELRAERDRYRARAAKLEDDLDQANARVVQLEKELHGLRDVRPTRPSEVQVAAAASELRLSRGDKLLAIFDTTLGEIRCDLLPRIAPNAVLNFVGLAEGTKEWTDPRTGQPTSAPLYEGTKIHKVIPGFLLEGGDPLGTGRGGPGYTFPDEVWPDVRFDRPGVLAMANSGANTNGSRFIITGSPQPTLNMRHTIFGLCDTETVQDILSVPVGGADKSTPQKDILVRKVRIERVSGDRN